MSCACSFLMGFSRWFTALVCSPGHPELSNSYMDMASKILTFTFTPPAEPPCNAMVLQLLTHAYSLCGHCQGGAAIGGLVQIPQAVWKAPFLSRSLCVQTRHRLWPRDEISATPQAEMMHGMHVPGGCSALTSLGAFIRCTCGSARDARCYRWYGYTWSGATHDYP